ncbi:MAG TPA: tetratricopeptide repeat protein [Chthoniobacterales bacterium]
MSEFFRRLKERKLVQWAVAYVAAAFALLQGIDIVASRFGWPDWIERALIIASCIGFFVIVVLAWYHGERGAQRVSSTELVILALLLSLGGAFLWRYTAISQPKIAPLPIASSPSPSASSVRAIPEKSIAVLPFENLSDDKSNAYFAEGIQDEILTRLAKIGDLKVISRTSTQHFKSSPENLPEIAQQLGVRNILEGSVQREPNEVRVNVQLINAMTDAHLWAEIYDRKMTDVFSVESDIAKTIAETLQAKLTGSEKTALAARPTENPEAYQLYLKGRFFWNKRTGSDLKTAASYFEQAIAADPGYSGAYAGLAQAELLIPVFGAGKPGDYFPKAMVAARRAIALDETSAEGHAALGMLQVFDFKFESSEDEFKRAIALNPNYATAHHWYGNSLLVTLGRFDEAIAQGRRAVELDPLSLIINADLGGDYTIARRYDQAIAQLRRTLALDENFAYAHWNLGEALYLKGNLSAAIAEYQKAAALDDDPEILALLGRAYAETGQKEKALELLQKLKEIGGRQYVRNYVYTIIYTGLGDKKTAIDYLEKAREGSESPDTTWMKVDPLFDPLRSEPRFQALIAALFPATES